MTAREPLLSLQHLLSIVALTVELKGLVQRWTQQSIGNGRGWTVDKKEGCWAWPGFEPGTSRTRSANHTPRPSSRWYPRLWVHRMTSHVEQSLLAKESRWTQSAFVAEWLRRWTWNPMGFPRAGSNPAGCGLFLGQKEREKEVWYVRCGVRTHAIFRLWELKSHALDHSANLTLGSHRKIGQFRWKSSP